MGFIAKGENIIIRPESGGSTVSLLFKRQNENGSYSDAVWGSKGEDFDSPISNSTWTSYGAYKYMNIGLVRQVYDETHTFNRNTRFDSTIRLSNTVAPVGSDISGIQYITAAVKGSLTADTNTIVQTLIDEFSAGEYTNTIAIGRMNQDIQDYRAVNIDVNNIKTMSGAADSVQDYDLSTDEAIYLLNVALISNADIEGITSLSINIYQQYFIEFSSDAYVAPGTIGKTEMDPDYKAERAINNHIIVINDENIVDSDTTVVISPDEAVQIDNNSIYYLYFNTTNTASIAYISLGYFDTDAADENVDGVYVPVGTLHPVTVSGTISNKLCYAVIINNEFTVEAIL